MDARDTPLDARPEITTPTPGVTTEPSGSASPRLTTAAGCRRLRSVAGALAQVTAAAVELDARCRRVRSSEPRGPASSPRSAARSTRPGCAAGARSLLRTARVGTQRLPVAVPVRTACGPDWRPALEERGGRDLPASLDAGPGGADGRRGGGRPARRSDDGGGRTSGGELVGGSNDDTRTPDRQQEERARRTVHAGGAEPTVEPPWSPDGRAHPGDDGRGADRGAGATTSPRTRPDVEPTEELGREEESTRRADRGAPPPRRR
jgi:hypothetical protein